MTSNNLNIHPPEGSPRKFYKGYEISLNALFLIKNLQINDIFSSFVNQLCTVYIKTHMVGTNVHPNALFSVLLYTKLQCSSSKKNSIFISKDF